MIDGSKNSRLFAEWYAFIEDPGVRDAFLYLTGLAAVSTRYRCDILWKGEVRNFRFHEAFGEHPHSFITNQKWLLFYFRPPAIRSNAYERKSLELDFDSFEETPRGEWHIKLKSIADVQKLSRRIRWHVG